MEGNKRGERSSSSSFAWELFGSKDSSSSSTTGILGSIFAPTSNKVLKREWLRSEGVGGAKQDSPGTESSWDTKLGVSSDGGYKSDEDGSRALNRDSGANYHEQRLHPCHLSSSIYYGGQDVYNHPQSSQGPNTNLMGYVKGGFRKVRCVVVLRNWLHYFIHQIWSSTVTDYLVFC